MPLTKLMVALSGARETFEGLTPGYRRRTIGLLLTVSLLLEYLLYLLADARASDDDIHQDT